MIDSSVIRRVRQKNGCPVPQEMTLRDYFAAMAVQGMLAHDGTFELEHLAPRAYAIADSLMQERDRLKHDQPR